MVVGVDGNLFAMIFGGENLTFLLTLERVETPIRYTESAKLERWRPKRQ